ncbi:MAG: class I SAM-dependent methyltransferase [Candidatus Sericytochromatia bacterium]|nr:class I SAM-dependent methyltransferase [Candidatus Sericytochromatia bacterium]
MELEAYREMAATEATHWWFAARRAISRAVIARLGLPRPARLLEVGAGTGGNWPMLAEFGSVAAVEASPEAIALAREALPPGLAVDLREGRLPEAMPFAGPFDLVCLFDVLEHIEDDAAALRALAPLCGPTGRLLLTVPAHPWLWSAHDAFLHHRRRYTAAGLRACLEAAGFEVLRLTPLNAWLFPLVAGARLLGRLTGGAGAVGSPLPPPWLNGLLRAIYASERHWLARADLPVGVSLLAVARPR